MGPKNVESTVTVYKRFNENNDPYTWDAILHIIVEYQYIYIISFQGLYMCFSWSWACMQ